MFSKNFSTSKSLGLFILPNGFLFRFNSIKSSGYFYLVSSFEAFFSSSVLSGRAKVLALSSLFLVS